MTKTNDFLEITSKLDGTKIEYNSISFSQVLLGERGESHNDMLFVKTMYGLSFYTSKSAVEQAMYLNTIQIPTYVVGSSKRVYEIKK